MTETNRGRRVRTLKLEGRIAGPWVTEFRKVAENWLAGSEGFQVDLADVTFVDAEGVELLRRLLDRQVELARPSRFIADLVAEDGR